MGSEWSSNGVRLTEIEEGIIVTQDGQQYLARKWRLNDDLLGLITKFINAGFECLIRSTHPQVKNRTSGVAYIGFSASKSEPWLAVIDQHSKQNPIRRITVNSLFRDLLTEAKIPYRWENAGGKNMFVATQDIDILLEAINPEFARNVILPTSKRNTHSILPSALAREEMLQSLLVSDIHDNKYKDIFGNVSSVNVNPRWRTHADSLDPQLWDIPDVIVETPTTIWVLELKLNEVGVQAADQVARYVLNPACDALASGRDIRAITIGHRLSPDLVNSNTICCRGVDVLLWTYSFNSYRGLQLRWQQDLLC